MFGSQVLETLIGLVTMFLVLSTAASAITEVISGILSKRAKDLERTLGDLLVGDPVNDTAIIKAKEAVQDAKNQVNKAKSAAEKLSSRERLKSSKGQLKAVREAVEIRRRELLKPFKATSIWTSAASATKNKLRLTRRDIMPSYLSAKAFAEAVMEMLDNDGVLDKVEMPPNLKKRLESLVLECKSLAQESKGDLIAVKAGLERWFDETMERLGGAYKRWATLSLFLVGFILAGLLNASTLNVAHDLWKDSVTRQTVVDSASKLVEDGGGAEQLSAIAGAADRLQQLDLPLGWDGQRAADFFSSWHWTVSLAGWLLTALLVMMGAPFWFDLLSRLANLRTTGPKPPLAAEDETSANKFAKSATLTPATVVMPAATDQKATERKVS
jgi:hypothetical protein